LNKDELLDNKIRNSYINSMLDYSPYKNIVKEDSLNKLLLSFYPSTDDLELDYKFSAKSERSGQGIIR
jgi:hypothetical protein